MAVDEIPSAIRPGRWAAGFFYRILAAGLLVFGSILLVKVYLPIVNPQLFEWGVGPRGRAVRIRAEQLGADVQPLSWYLIGTLLALTVLGLAWHFNIRSLRARGELK